MNDRNKLLQDVKEAWNKIYADYDSVENLPWVNTDDPVDILSLFINRIYSKKNSGTPVNILDFGCGNGRIGRCLQEKFGNKCIVHYYDISERALDYCKSKGIPDDMVISDISKCKVSFDGIIVWGVFHHMPNQLWDYQIDIINSLLTPEGIILFGDFTKEDILFSKENKRKSEVTDIDSYAVDFDFLAKSNHILSHGEFRFFENKKFSECREHERCMHYIIAERSLVDQKEALIKQKIIGLKTKPAFWHFVKYTFSDSLFTPSGRAVKFISESNPTNAQRLWMEGLTLFRYQDALQGAEKVSDKSLSEEMMLQYDNKTSFYVYGTANDGSLDGNSEVSVEIKWKENEDNGFYTIHLHAPKLTIKKPAVTFQETHSFSKFINDIKEIPEDELSIDGYDKGLILKMREALEIELKNIPGIPTLPVLMMLLMVWPSSDYPGKTFVFIQPSVLEEIVDGEKKEISAGGLILFFSKLLEENETFERRLIPIVNRWASLYTTQELAKFTRNKSVVAAIAKAMARNMSHNLGSHVLSNFISKDSYSKMGDSFCAANLKQYASISDNDLTPGLFDDNANHQSQYFMQYLKSRMDYLSEITFGVSDMVTTKMLYADVMKELDRVRLMLNHISGISNFKYSFRIVKNVWSTDVMMNEKEDIAAAFPNDILGCQAFYNIIENIIRNTAKHHDWSYDTNSNVVFTVRIKDANCSRKGTEKGEDQLYCIEIDDGLKKDNIYSLVTLQNEKLNESVLDKNHNLRSNSLGLLEMKASAAFLRQIELVDAVSENFNGIKILEAFNAEGALGYRFYLQKPKEFIFIGDSWSIDEDKTKDEDIKQQLARNAGIEFMGCNEFKSSMESGKAIAHKFLIYDSTLDKSILFHPANKTLLPLRQLFIETGNDDFKGLGEIMKNTVPNKVLEKLNEFSWGKIVEENNTSDVVAFMNHGGLEAFVKQNAGCNLCVENTLSNTQEKYPHFRTYASSDPSPEKTPWENYLDNIPASIKKEICEAYKSKIIIIDERVQRFAEDNVEGEIPCWALFDTTEIKIPRYPETDDKGQYILPMKLHYNETKREVKKVRMSNLEKNKVIPLDPKDFAKYKDMLEKYIDKHIKDSYLIIHYGILERLYGRNKEQIKRMLNQWATGRQSPSETECPEMKHAKRVVVTSGRGAHSLNLPDTVCFASLSSVLYACTENRNKFIINNLINQSRRKRI